MTIRNAWEMAFGEDKAEEVYKACRLHMNHNKWFPKVSEIKEKLWKGQLWNHSYYVETIGSVSEENIRRYIEHQTKAY